MAEQLMFDGMPDPDFDKRGFSDAQIARAEKDVTDYDLLDECFGFTDRAIPTAWQTVSDCGKVRTRLTFEVTKHHLVFEEGASHLKGMKSNNLAAVMARRIADKEPELAPFIVMDLTPVDVVLAKDGGTE